MKYVKSENNVSDICTKNLPSKLFEKHLNKLVSDVGFVGDKICPGAECTKIKSSTTNTEDVQTDENDTVASTTAGTTQT